MRISAKADYAVRAALELAAAPDGEPVKGERLSEAQEIPLQFLEHILLELKHARLVRTKRGAKGGYWLARPPDEITLADVIRAVEGPRPTSRMPRRSKRAIRATPSACARCGSRCGRTCARCWRT
jgi:Rrf2 family protein